METVAVNCDVEPRRVSAAPETVTTTAEEGGAEEEDVVEEEHPATAKLLRRSNLAKGEHETHGDLDGSECFSMA